MVKIQSEGKTGWDKLPNIELSNANITKEVATQIFSYLSPHLLIYLRCTNKAWYKHVEYLLSNAMPSFFRQTNHKDYLCSLQLAKECNNRNKSLHYGEIPLTDDIKKHAAKDDLLVTVGKFITLYDLNTLEPVTMFTKPERMGTCEDIIITQEGFKIIDSPLNSVDTHYWSWKLTKRENGLDVIFEGEIVITNHRDRFQLNLPKSLKIHADVSKLLNDPCTRFAKFCPEEDLIVVSADQSLSVYDVHTGDKKWEFEQSSGLLAFDVYQGHIVIVSFPNPSQFCFYNMRTKESIEGFSLDFGGRHRQVSRPLFTNRGLMIQSGEWGDQGHVNRIRVYTNRAFSKSSEDHLKIAYPIFLCLNHSHILWRRR